MADSRTMRGILGAGFGIVTLLLVAGDTIQRIAPDRLPLGFHHRPGEAIAAIAVPALYLLFGRLAVGGLVPALGLPRSAVIRGLLAVFVLALGARMIDSATYGVDPLLALAASLYWPDGSFAVLPGLAFLVLVAPRLSALRPFFVVGLGAGLFLSDVSTGIVFIDAAAANALFFLVGLAGHRLIDGFVAAVGRERGEVLLCAAFLVAINLFVAHLGIARAPLMALVLGCAGSAIVLTFAAELASTRAGAGLAWTGARLVVGLIGAELPLALIGRGPAGSTLGACSAIAFVIVATLGLAWFATWSARRGAAHALYRRAAMV